jgi:periplasmic protein TonB
VNSLQRVSFREDEPSSTGETNGIVGMIPGSHPTGVTGGVIGGIIGSVAQQSKDGRPLKIRVSQGVSQALLTRKVQPRYPDDARRARIQGVVVLTATIDTNRDLEELTLVSGHPLLAPAALEAAKQWKCKPYLLNGMPAKVETRVSVLFQLAAQSACVEVRRGERPCPTRGQLKSLRRLLIS